MIKFLNLIQNENMKIYRRVRTWIMLGFIPLVPLLVSLVMYFASQGGQQPSGWFVMWIETLILSYLIAIFTAVVAADSVAGEFSRGTIKLLLIRPWSRSSILLSKFVAVILFGLLFTVLSFAVTFILNLALFGDAGSAADLPNQALSASKFIVRTYLYDFISLIVVASFAFMLSAAFQSSGLAIGLAIFLQLWGSIGIFTLILSAIDKPWTKYIIFPHLQLSSYLLEPNGPVPHYPTTLGFSLAVLAGYFVVFNLISWLVFNKRDISA